MKFRDFAIHDLEELFAATGLLLIHSHEKFKQEYYPRCMCLFGSNPEYQFEEHVNSFMSEVKGLEIWMKDKQFGGILNNFAIGEDLEETKTSDPMILQQIFQGE